MFCRIYLWGPDLDSYNIAILICNELSAKFENGRDIEKDGYSMSVRRNFDRDEKEQLMFPDGFLHFPLCIEIDIQESIIPEHAAVEVGILLEALWKMNFSAVASCDFEDLLPEKGGYKSEKIPWPGRESKMGS